MTTSENPISERRTGDRSLTTRRGLGASAAPELPFGPRRTGRAVARPVPLFASSGFPPDPTLGYPTYPAATTINPALPSSPRRPTRPRGVRSIDVRSVTAGQGVVQGREERSFADGTGFQAVMLERSLTLVDDAVVVEAVVEEHGLGPCSLSAVAALRRAQIVAPQHLRRHYESQPAEP